MFGMQLRRHVKQTTDQQAIPFGFVRFSSVECCMHDAGSLAIDNLNVWIDSKRVDQVIEIATDAPFRLPAVNLIIESKFH